MPIQVIAGLILWGLFIVFVICAEVTVRNMQIENPIVKFFVATIAFPVVGVILWSFGWVFSLIGETILASLKYFI